MSAQIPSSSSTEQATSQPILRCATQSVLYTTTVMVTSLDGLTVSKRASENGRSHWSLAAGLTQDSFLTPSETTASERGVQQTDGMHPALQRPQLPDRQKGLSSPPPRLPARLSTPQSGGVLSCEALPHPPSPAN